jgi:class 3 adenylate cyclase
MEAHSVKRKLAAILAADVKGYSRLMGEDEEATLHTLNTYRGVTDPLIEQYSGRVVSTAEEAIKTLREARMRDPNFLGPYLFLAVAYIRSGREAEARGEVAEILRLNLHFSLEGVRQRLSSQDPAKNEHLIDALRKAGLK